MTVPPPPDSRTAFDLVPALLRGPDGRIWLWTTGAERLYGWPRDAALGQHEDALLGTEPAEPWARIGEALRRDGTWQGSVRQRMADGRWLDLVAHWSTTHGSASGAAQRDNPQRDNPQRDNSQRDNSQRDDPGPIEGDAQGGMSRSASGSVLGSPPGPANDGAAGVLEVAVGPSILDGGAEAAFRLAAIVDSSEEAIIGKDLAGRITSWNRAAEQMLGYTAAEIIGCPIALVLPDGLLADEAAVLERIGRGELVGRHESTRRRKDGSIVPVFLSISPVRDGSGRIVGAATIARDISDQKHDREALRTSQMELVHVSRLSELGQIASALAHEVNQPLAAIANYAAAGRRTLATGNVAGAAKALERIGEQAGRGGEIVQRLRDFMRKRPTEKRPESLAAVIEEALALAMIGVRTRPILFTRTLDPTAATAVLDRIQIEQVLFNLMRNAIEAMADAPHQELTVATRRLDPERVEIAIADTGPGLPEAIRAQLFQPFVTTKANGLGIGLSICRSIVQAHDGTVTAEANPGGGTIFRITLPAPAGDGTEP